MALECCFPLRSRNPATLQGRDPGLLSQKHTGLEDGFPLTQQSHKVLSTGSQVSIFLKSRAHPKLLDFPFLFKKLIKEQHIQGACTGVCVQRSQALCLK